MKLLFSTFLLLMSIALIAGGSAAQVDDRPIFAFRNGDIWKLDLAGGIAQPLTHWDSNGGPILSPNGAEIVFLSLSPEFVAQYEAGATTQAGGAAPANIWVMDVASETFTLIADQTGASAAGILRSLPNWSPDSRQLAWLQLDPGAQTLDSAQLLLHDLESGAASTLVAKVDLGFQASDIRMPSLRWGDGGIAWLHFDFANGGQNPFLHIQFLDPTSGEMKQYDLGLKETRGNTVRDFMWVKHLGRSLMALQIQNYWDVIDPQDGSRSRLSAPPRLQNRNRPGGLQLIPHAVEDGRGGWVIHWHASSGVNIFDTGYRSARVNRNYRPALSSDGMAMAWQDDERVSLWRLGSAEGSQSLAEIASRWEFPLPQPFGLVWAPSEWVTSDSLARAQVAPALEPRASGCDLAPLLRPGQQAAVSPGLANRVRDSASLEARVIGTIEASDVVTIDTGPVCADGYHWYSVRNERIAGWTAQGSDGAYWLLYHVNCVNSPPIRLTATMRAKVSDGYALSVRSGKGNVGTAVLAVAAPGDTFMITGWPECDSSGERWYPIQFDSMLGWIAAGSGDYYFIEAAG
ncbi:MAG: hypothetical protein OXG85_13425 [Chloroflexi bacterium]|nr:hypothetical protein [Chloroflexota bacterium]